MNPHPVPRPRELTDLSDIAFEATFVRELPGDPLLHNVSRAVRDACYTRVNPTPVSAPRLLGWSDALGEIAREHNAFIMA